MTACLSATACVSAILGAAWFVLLSAGFVVGRSGWFVGTPIDLWIGSSLVLVAAAWWRFVRTETPAWRRFAGWVAVGMTLGCCGDAAALLSGRIAEPLRLLLVMGLFGLGHVGYITACFTAQRILNLRLTRGWWGVVGFWLLLGVVAWAIVAAPTGQATARHAAVPLGLRLAGLGYAMFLAACTGCMTGLAWLHRRFLIMGLGAVSFLFSDVVLAAMIYRGDPTFLSDFSAIHPSLDFSRLLAGSDLCWITYGPGQMMIVFGAAYALRALENARIPGKL